MARRSAIYPGSFDPITRGHVDVARRALTVFDRLVVAVVANPLKRTLFTLEERVGLTRTSLRDEGIAGVEVIGYDGLLVDCARSHRVDAILRGLRATSDFEYEFQLALTNLRLEPRIETVLLMTEGRYAFLSSSTVKEIHRLGGDVGSLVPDAVRKALDRRLTAGPAQTS